MERNKEHTVFDYKPSAAELMFCGVDSLVKYRFPLDRLSSDDLETYTNFDYRERDYLDLTSERERDTHLFSLLVRRGAVRNDASYWEKALSYENKCFGKDFNSVFNPFLFDVLEYEYVKYCLWKYYTGKTAIKGKAFVWEKEYSEAVKKMLK